MKRLYNLILLLLVPTADAFRVGPLASTTARRSALSSCPPFSRAPGAIQPLFLSSTMGDDDDTMVKKVKGRKKRVLYGYRAAAIAHGSSSVLALATGITPVSCYTAAGPLLAGGLAYILAGAAVNDRLKSDTYKRLNIFLAKYGAIGLAVGALVPQSKLPFWYFWMIVSFVTTVNCIKGYGYGVKGWKLEGGMKVVKTDMVNQLKNGFKTIFSVPSNPQSTGYLASTLTATTLNVMKLVEIVRLITEQSDVRMIASHLIRYGKLLLLTGTSITLKDAADRGRLSGTTFIELNFLSAAVWGTMAAYLRNEAANAINPLVGATAFFSVMSALNGCLGIVAKKNKGKA